MPVIDATALYRLAPDDKVVSQEVVVVVGVGSAIGGSCDCVATAGSGSAGVGD